MSLTKGMELIIKFDKDQGFISSQKSLKLTQMGLDYTDKKFKSNAYWRVVIENINKEEGNLILSVLEYQYGVIDFLPIQHSETDFFRDINKVSFINIDSSGLLQTTDLTTDFLLANTSPGISKPRFNLFDHMAYLAENHISAKQQIKEEFQVALKKVRFKSGGVSFSRKFQKLQDQIEINIVNYDLRHEFDAVKDYFSKVLKTKKIRVSVKIEVEDNNVISIEASSPEIARINNTIIESVKFEFVKYLAKKKLPDTIDKNLFTMDEYYDTLSEKKVKSNTFHVDANALMEDLLQIKNAKHYKNLRYLSSKHAARIMKLRFVLKPFSFIFLIEGDKNYHIIWETLDTKEATYIWHVKKDINEVRMTLKKVEEIINIVKVQGKNSYITSSEDAYQRIYHDYSDMVDGFVKWKGNLERILT